MALQSTTYKAAGYSSNPKYSTPAYGPGITYTPANRTTASKVTTSKPKSIVGDVLGSNTKSVSNTQTIKSTPSTSSSKSSLSSLYEKQRSEMEEQRKRSEKQAREIGTAWNPVFESLDQQLGSIPVRQAEYQGRIAESTDAQLSDVEASRARSTESLETEKARGLRNLEDDIRNQMEVAGTKIGIAGAGSSSAVGQASEALARVGQKARGSLLEGVNEQLTSINNLASQERSKIGQWKQDKLGEIVSFFQNKMDELSFQKANAQKERKVAVEELIRDAQNQFVSALSGLDSEIRTYAQQVDTWEKQRQAELEDYARRTGQSAAQGSKITDSALAMFDELAMRTGSEDEARSILAAQGIMIPDGIRANTAEDDVSSWYGMTQQLPESPVAPVQNPFVDTSMYDSLFAGGY